MDKAISDALFEYWERDADKRRDAFAKAALAEEQPERRAPGNYPWGTCANAECPICGDAATMATRLFDAFVTPARPIAAMFDAPTPRERAEEKVRVLLNEDAPTKALAFTMLRAEGMDSDRAKMILRDAKWNLP